MMGIQRGKVWASVVVPITVLALVGCSGGESTGGEKVKEVEISMTEFAFSSKKIALTKGELLELTLKNAGAAEHEFVLVTPWAEFESELEPGHTDSMGFKFREKGAFEFVCELPGHREGGMVGQVVVDGGKPLEIPEVGGGEEKKQELRIELSDYHFTPDKIEVEKGTLLEITVVNAASQKHEMVIDVGGMEFEVEVEAGKEKSFGVKFLQSGTVKLVCELPGHLENGMKGEIVVK